MWRKIICRNKSSNSKSKSHVILILILIVCFEKPINCLTSLNNNGLLPANNFIEKCEQRCKHQFKRNQNFN
ncbi:CLUMA_CG004383, isoform A [Clunio marinus]|uniref:CLUMA_CG004383, isoform A n=1 Tax=Clunio marinus TaxID=568069 RepID=A0A1J1HVZ8_9DIPT|nr:CLUMA_CG004383, isoform A [Clunio marinus]